MTRGNTGTKIIKLKCKQWLQGVYTLNCQIKFKVKKDVILALILGLFLGALIAVITVRLPNFLEKKESAKKTTKVKEQIPESLPPTGLKLEITYPSDQSILDSSNVNLIGVSHPSTVLIIESVNESLVLESDKNGSFSANLKLIEGGNPVFITAVDNQGNNETKSVNLFYTSEKI